MRKQHSSFTRATARIFALTLALISCSPAIEKEEATTPDGPAKAPAPPDTTAEAKPAPESKTAATTDKPIRFVAYNLKNWLKMDRRVDGEFKENASKPEKEIAVMMRMLKEVKPDILGICEIGKKEALDDFAARLKKAGLDYPHIEYGGGADSTRRLALLSKYPIVARNSKSDLSYTLDKKEFKVQRGILDATVEVNPGYQLRTLGIHFKSKREVDYARQDLMRRNEAYILRKHMDVILEKDPTTNLIAYGDFNETKNEKPIRVVRGRFPSATHMTDIQLRDKHGYRWTYYWSYADIYQRFDFIFASKALLPEIDRDKSFIHTDPDWYTASDHRPIVLVVNPKNAEKKAPKKTAK